MIVDPILPLALVLPASVLLAAFAVWRMRRSGRGARLAWAGRLLMVALLLVIALRPSIPGSSTGPLATGGLEVYFMVDTTSSMAAEDVDPKTEDPAAEDPAAEDPAATRLDQAKSDIGRIAEALAGAKFSLTTFDSSAVQRVPLTSDATALLSATDAMTQEITYYSNGSGIDVAVPFMTDLLGEVDTGVDTGADSGASTGADRGANRVLFYIGDGEQTIAQPPGSFQQLRPFIDGGAVLGYGTENGGRMRVFDGFGADDDETEPAYIQDPDGSGDALSRMDESALTAVAGQLAVPFVAGGSDQLDAILSRLDVGDLRVQAPTASGPVEFYWISAIPLGILAAIETVLAALTIAALRPARRPQKSSVAGDAR